MHELNKMVDPISWLRYYFLMATLVLDSIETELEEMIF